jgi:uncharacterized YccA/Bax inhibitor family protein
MRTGNPVFKPELFEGNFLDQLRSGTAEAARPTTMTVRGTAIKSGILIAILAATAVMAGGFAQANPAAKLPMMLGGGVLSFIIGLVLMFKPTLSPGLAPVYAVTKGVFVGVVSLAYLSQFQVKVVGPINIVGQAVGLTVAVAGAIAIGYSAGLLRLGGTAQKVVIGATLGLLLFYAAQIVLGLFGIQFLTSVHGSGPIGIAFSLFVIGLASFNLIMDFQMAEEGAANGAPKYMEWYVGFGIMVTLVWLYLEILRLLGKLNSRD